MIAKIITGALACSCLLLALELERMRPYWPQSRTIEKTSVAMASPSPESDEALLQVVVPEVTFNGQPLNIALARLTDQTSVNIVGDWKTLQSVGITKTEPVTVSLHNATIAQTLDQIAQCVATENQKPSFYVADGIVTVTSAESAALASRHITTHFIDIRPLVMELQRVSLPQGHQVECPPPREIFGNRSKIRLPFPALHLSYGEIIGEITTQIIRTIDPDGWRDNGGNIGSIGDIGGVLAVTSTPGNIKRIRAFLDELQKVAAAGNVPKLNLTLGKPITGRSATLPADRDAAAKTVTECFNLRPLVERFNDAFELPVPERLIADGGGILDDIGHVTSSIVAPESWQDNGGSIGIMQQIAWSQIVTQTPENIARIKTVYDCLARASVARHFPPPSEVPLADFVAGDRIFYDGDPGGRFTEFINIRPLTMQIRARAPLPNSIRQGRTPAEALEQISGRLVTDNADPETWLDNGGSEGRIGGVGSSVLTITHKRNTLEKARKILDCVERASTAKHFPRLPAVAPASGFVRAERIRITDGDQTAIEFINIAPLVERLAANLPRDADAIMEPIGRLFMETIEPDSWMVDGGKVGSVYSLGPVLVVRQSPAALERVWNELDRLDRAIGATHFAPAGGEPAGRPEIVPADRRAIAPSARVTAFINILPLLRAWSAHLSKDELSAGNLIQLHVEAAVAPASWVSLDNRTYEIGGVLIVSSTPQIVEAVRDELELTYRKMLRGEFPPTAPPPGATTQPVNGQ